MCTHTRNALKRKSLCMNDRNRNSQKCTWMKKKKMKSRTETIRVATIQNHHLRSICINCMNLCCCIVAICPFCAFQPSSSRSSSSFYKRAQNIHTFASETHREYRRFELAPLLRSRKKINICLQMYKLLEHEQFCGRTTKWSINAKRQKLTATRTIK